MAIVLTIKETNYFVVGLFYDLAGHLLYIYDTKFFIFAVCFNFVRAREGTMPSPYVVPPISLSAYKAFLNKNLSFYSSFTNRCYHCLF